MKFKTVALFTIGLYVVSSLSVKNHQLKREIVKERLVCSLLNNDRSLYAQTLIDHWSLLDSDIRQRLNESSTVNVAFYHIVKDI